MKPHFFITDVSLISRELSRTEKQTFKSWDYPDKIFEVPNSSIISENVEFKITLKSSGNVSEIRTEDIELALYLKLNETYYPNHKNEKY
jgi:hypothetical protein